MVILWDLTNPRDARRIGDPLPVPTGRVSSVAFSLLTEFLRLQFPYAFLILLGTLLILLVLYLPGGLASLIQRRWVRG